MSEVKRYMQPCARVSHDPFKLQTIPLAEHPEGEYVLAADHEAEVARLKEALDEIASTDQCELEGAESVAANCLRKIARIALCRKCKGEGCPDCSGLNSNVGQT